MFKKKLRFSFRSGFPKKKLVTPLFILRYETSNEPKYAVIAGKTVSKKAVLRNKTKRMVVTLLQELLLKAPTKNTIVLFLRRPYTQYSKSVIISELQNVFEKINANK